MDEFDDDYVRRLLGGDPQTGDHFDRYFRALMTAMLRRRKISPTAIPDIIQIVFIRVLERLHKIEDGRKLGAFVKGVLDKVIHEHFRQFWRTPQLDPKQDYPGNFDVHGHVYVVILKRQVRAVLGEMEKKWPEDAALLRAVYLDEESRDEVGRRLNITPENFRVRLHRAKKKFLEIWREWFKNKKH